MSEQASEIDGENMISGMASSLVTEMPRPSEHAIESERVDGDRRDSMRDVDGTIFDPTVHAVDPHGNPSLTRGDRFRKKRKTDGSTLSRSADASPATYAPDSYHEAATATVDGIGTLGAMFGGEEWAFRSYADKDTKVIILDERENGIRAFERFFREKNIKDIPPGIAIAIWGIGYAGARFAQSEETRASARNTWKWLKSKFTRKKPEDNYQPSDDEKGEY